MADPRRTSTRRAVLSYDQYKDLYRSIGIELPDLLVKDYQGILQDFVFTSDEIDALDVRVTKNEADIAALDIRVTENEEDIVDLQLRVAALEYRVYEIIETTVDITAEAFQIVICKNTTPINVTLKPSALSGDKIRVKRRGAAVTMIGTVNGNQNPKINIKNSAPMVVFDGTDWSTI